MFAILAAGLVAASASAQVISVDEESISVDGQAINLPALEESVKLVFGVSPVAHLELADEYSNRVFHWLNIGVAAFSNPRNQHVHALEFLFSKPPYWQGVSFCGRISVAGHELPPDGPVAALEKFGFRDTGGWWEWRTGCTYVIVQSENGESISEVEIGVEEDRAVFPPLLPRATPACR